MNLDCSWTIITFSISYMVIFLCGFLEARSTKYQDKYFLRGYWSLSLVTEFRYITPKMAQLIIFNGNYSTLNHEVIRNFNASLTCKVGSYSIYSYRVNHQWASVYEPVLIRALQDILPSELKLGDPCRSSYECLHYLHHSHCDWDTRTCACQPYHFEFNNTWCLPASLLGYSCAVDQQCQIKVKNSECGTHKLCQCKENFMQLRKDKCLPPAKVHDYCLNDRQCQMADKLSFCKYIIPKVYGKCHCPLGSMVSADGHCYPHLGGECLSDDDCLHATPNSACQKKGKRSKFCQCVKGYKASKNGMKCDIDLSSQILAPAAPPKPVSLGKPCLTSSQCQARDPYTECINGRCECIQRTPECSSANTQCLNDTFQCTNGQCISWYFVCDGEQNCVDGTDEENCIPFNCPIESFMCNDGTCLSKSAVCNGRWECPDGSDEARCYTGIPCDRNSFRCKNGQCLPAYAFCNAVIDCYDGSDESFESCERGENCPDNSFQCNNSRCRSTAILCSGLDGCGDNSDEDRCEVCRCPKPE